MREMVSRLGLQMIENLLFEVDELKKAGLAVYDVMQKGYQPENGTASPYLGLPFELS